MIGRFRNSYVACFMIGVCIGVFVVMPPPELWAIEYPRGDLNGDGVLSQADADLLRGALLRAAPTFETQTEGDMNADGRIGASDIVAILNYGGDRDKDGVADFEDDFPFDPE